MAEPCRPSPPPAYRVCARGHCRKPDHRTNLLKTTAPRGGKPAAGSYATTCSGAVDANYTSPFLYVPGTVTVGQAAPLTITASSRHDDLWRDRAVHHPPSTAGL